MYIYIKNILTRIFLYRQVNIYYYVCLYLWYLYFILTCYPCFQIVLFICLVFLLFYLFSSIIFFVFVIKYNFFLYCMNFLKLLFGALRLINIFMFFLSIVVLLCLFKFLLLEKDVKIYEFCMCRICFLNVYVFGLSDIYDLIT